MRIAVSACLLGEPCRYDGEAKPSEEVIAFASEHEVLPICPEVEGGLPTPRAPSELQAAAAGGCEGRMRVVNREGSDVTEAFERGAEASLRAMREFGCEMAVLKAKSPSCGTGLVYDGSFTGRLVPGWGVAAALIRDAGIPVTDENGCAGHARSI